MNVLIYDAEIEKCIPPKDGKLDPRFSYCKGWRDFEGMGISTCSYGYLYSDDFTVFAWDDEEARQRFVEEALNAFMSGFNSRAFDDLLMAAHGVSITTRYDILEEVRIAAFGSPRWQDTPKGCSYSLDAITQANGMTKTGNGARAPELWQQGYRQDVLDYCGNDLVIERAVMRLLFDGKLVDPNTGRYLKGRPLIAEAK